MTSAIPQAAIEDSELWKAIVREMNQAREDGETDRAFIIARTVLRIAIPHTRRETLEALAQDAEDQLFGPLTVGTEVAAEVAEWIRAHKATGKGK